jgi:hypothetical protein
MFADIFITTCRRPDLFRRSLESFERCTPRDQYRLTVVQDGADAETSRIIEAAPFVDNVIFHRENVGLGPSINQALSYIDSMKRWDGGITSAFSLTAYVQDDVAYSPGWLDKLAVKFIRLAAPLKLGFASGIECVEHPIKKDLGNGLVLKDWIRATCMLSYHSYWMSMWPVSRIDPETGRERGKPNDGWGSGVDLWFVRNHENSVCRTGRTNLVIPGLLQHMGYDRSTWLDRELPESESDKRIVESIK